MPRKSGPPLAPGTQEEIRAVYRHLWSQIGLECTVRDLERACHLSHWRVHRAIAFIKGLNLVREIPGKREGCKGRPATRYLAIGNEDLMRLNYTKLVFPTPLRLR